MNQIFMVIDKSGQTKKNRTSLLRKRKHNYFSFRTLGEKTLWMTNFCK